MKNKINIIVATDMSHVMAKNGEIPWHCSSDFKFFKNKTSNNVIVMGKKTYDTIGHPLPQRTNIVLDHTYKSNSNPVCDNGYDPYYVYNNIDQSLQMADTQEKDIFICGGLSIYKKFLEMNIVDTVFINVIKTLVNYDKDNDAIMKFPDISEYSTWVLTECKDTEDFLALKFKNENRKDYNG